MWKCISCTGDAVWVQQQQLAHLFLNVTAQEKQSHMLPLLQMYGGTPVCWCGLSAGVLRDVALTNLQTVIGAIRTPCDGIDWSVLGAGG